MTNLRIGLDVSAEEYWKKRTAYYCSKIDVPYNRHRLKVIAALLNGVDLSGARCVDFGCGEGVMLEEVALAGARVTGIDINEEMIVAADQRLRRAGLAGDVRVGGIEQLDRFESDSIDCLLALNVMNYFSADQERQFYQQARRILRPCGCLVVVHSNELFDLFTLNVFTVEFFAKHLVGGARRGQIASLLTHPREPQRVRHALRENPLTYRLKLARYGLEEQQQEFANYHPLPPQLLDSQVPFDVDAKEYADTINLPEAERWKLMLQCSMFGSRAIKRASPACSGDEPRGEVSEKTMTTWHRITPLGHGISDGRIEVWECRDRDRVVLSWPVQVELSKPLEVVEFKGDDVTLVRRMADSLARAAAILYGPEQKLVRVSCCPACGSSIGDAPKALRVFNIAYRRCRGCGHLFVSPQPTAEALRRRYTDAGELSDVYVDRRAAEFRIEQVAEPKLRWVRDILRKSTGRDCCTILDVGAGGGHFVEACRRSGLAAEGHELSERGRRFAREAFHLNLRGGDCMVSADGEAVDVVTFWGMLQYMSQPLRYLQYARGRITETDGLVVVEVPRAESLSTTAQRIWPSQVARHLDPTSHLHVYSDSSIVWSLVRAGLRPVAAWYFGMDAYELLNNLALLASDASLVRKASEAIGELQRDIDRAQYCDSIVIAARAMSEREQEAVREVGR